MNTTIAHEAPRANDGSIDVLGLTRQLVEAALNEIMDVQAGEACADSGNARNGYRERKLVTTVGTLNLRIPKLRMGSYFPEDVLERYSRTDKAVVAAVSEMYANGVSTRKVEKVAHALGVDKMSSQQVSRICSALDEEVAQLRRREFADMRFPYLWLDATYLKCRRDGHVASTAVVTAIAVGEDGCRRFVGIDVVHLERNVAKLMPDKRRKAMALKALQSVFREQDPTFVRAAYHAAIDAVAEMSAKAAELLEEAECDALAYLDFPLEHHRRLRTNNVQERANREIKRRGRVVQVFPSAASLLRLIGAVCAEMDEDWSSRRYMGGEAVSAFYEEQEVAKRQAQALASAAAITEEVRAHACKLIELAVETACRKAA